MRLTDAERAVCEATIQIPKGSSEKRRRATILLQANADGPAWRHEKIRAAVGCRTPTVLNGRQAFVREGFEAARGRHRRAEPLTPPR